MLHVAMCRVYVAAAYEPLNYVDSDAFNNGPMKVTKKLHDINPLIFE